MITIIVVAFIALAIVLCLAGASTPGEDTHLTPRTEGLEDARLQRRIRDEYDEDGLAERYK